MLKVVKIGGNVVDNSEKLDRFLQDFASLEGPKVLVHGGGKIATTIGKALGIETQMIGGRRVTDAETLKVVTMVYAGLINKTIVAKLRTAGCNAVGLCGADGGLIVSRRRNPKPVDYGFVGDPELERFGTATAKTLIDAGYTLVVAPITVDGADGSLLNTYDGRRAVRDVRDRIGLLFRETGRADGCRRRPQRDPGDYAGAVCAASCGRDRGGRYAAETRECVRRD